MRVTPASASTSASASSRPAARAIPVGAGPVRIATRIARDADEATDLVAAKVAAVIRDCATKSRRCVLGLPTGSTPLRVYARLIAEHRAGLLSFAHVVTFNLDEYHGLPPGDHAQSYRRFMRDHLFAQVDIDPANVHIPRGDVPVEAVPADAAAYERAITDAGGLDLMLLGIGRNGHIGFNEPGSSRDSRTRLVALDRLTRQDASSAFGGEPKVPRRGVTMGVGSILAARQVVLLALGEHKAAAVVAAIEGPVTAQLPASFLQDHPAAEMVLDPAAAARLSAVRAPWLVGAVEWDDRLVAQAVTTLAETVKRPLLKLIEADYADHGLQELVAARGPVHEINLSVFRGLTATITGWPGGKPPHRKRPGDIPRSRDEVYPKRVLVLSPHPDDDVISMGGTLNRLTEQGHQVHVAYQTSGHGGVHDDDLRRHLEFVAAASPHLKLSAPTDPDPAARKKLKALIRRSEALAACRDCGLANDRLRFLDLPFYDRRDCAQPLGDDDVAIMVSMLEELKPHQIYAAGDCNDPHGTHLTCLRVMERAIERMRAQDWFQSCEVWLYRGAWAEWEPYEIGMAVPLAPADVERKRLAILRHQSQKDRVLHPGDDQREFWQRAADRNRASAERFDRLGLAEYAAIEAFARWTPGVVS